MIRVKRSSSSYYIFELRVVLAVIVRVVLAVVLVEPEVLVQSRASASYFFCIVHVRRRRALARCQRLDVDTVN